MSDQSFNDSGSRRLRREAERRRLLEEQLHGASRARSDEPLPGRSLDDVSPPAGGDGHSGALSRRELRERAAGATGGSADGYGQSGGHGQSGGGVASGGYGSAEDTGWAARRATEAAESAAASTAGQWGGPAAQTPDPGQWGGPAPQSPSPEHTAPGAAERPLSRRELRERAETAAGAAQPARERPDTAVEQAFQNPVRDYQAPAEPYRAPDEPYRAPAEPYLAPEQRSTVTPPESPEVPTRRRRAAADEPDAAQRRYDAPAEQYPSPAEQYPSLGEQYPSPAEREGRGQRPYEGVTAPSDDVAQWQAPEDPAVPARASLRDRMAARDSGPIAQPDVAPAPSGGIPAGPDAPAAGASSTAPENPIDTPVAAAPARISPQERAAAIRAQAARAQAEREEAARGNMERLSSRRAAAQVAQGESAPVPAGQPQPQAEQPQGAAPASMWGNPSAAGQGQDRPEPMADGGFADRPPVRRVVLPPLMATGSGPADIPGSPQAWSAPPGQPGQAQPGQAQPGQAQPGQQHPAGPQPTQGAAPAVGQPFGTVTMAPDDRAVAQPPAGPMAPGAPGGPGGPVDPAGPLPRWGSVGPGQGGWGPTPSAPPNGGPSAPNGMPAAPRGGMPAAPQSGMPPTGTNGWPAGPAGSAGLPVPPVGVDIPPPSDDEDDDGGRRHPYTWLHMIVLVLVAFVLGMLIFMVVMKDTPAGGATAAGESVDAASGQVQVDPARPATEQTGD